MRDGQAGVGHPPWRGGEVGGGVFLKGCERPEAKTRSLKSRHASTFGARFRERVLARP